MLIWKNVAYLKALTLRMTMIFGPRTFE